MSTTSWCARCTRADALPADIGCLQGYMRMIEGLLEEKASELEPSWEAACAIATEIETLHALETAVAERVIAMRALTASTPCAGSSRYGARSVAGADDSDERSPRNRLILSVDADLERMARRRLNAPSPQAAAARRFRSRLKRLPGS
ncbi:MAG: hypothetical protein U1E59_01755 [Amaricoccus sp.]